MKLKSTHYICKMKCLSEVYINFTSEFKQSYAKNNFDCFFRHGV